MKKLPKKIQRLFSKLFEELEEDSEEYKGIKLLYDNIMELWNIMNNEFKLTKKNQTLTILPISDVHYGSPQCDTEYFEFMLNKFDKVNGQKIIYLLGDECDVATKRQGNSSYRQKTDVNEQLEYIINHLKPFKKHIRGIVQSNHMARTNQRHGVPATR